MRWQSFKKDLLCKWTLPYQDASVPFIPLFPTEHPQRVHVAGGLMGAIREGEESNA